MKTITIPGTDLTVSQVALGTVQFGAGIPAETAYTLMDRFVQHGGNLIDSARVYACWMPDGANASEKTIGAWMKRRGLRDQMVISTKGAHPDLKTMHISRMSRDDIMADVDESLHYLDIDSIDLYWLHRDDSTLPVGDILETLNELVQAGKIRYFGASNWSTARIQEANDYAQEHDLQGFVANQPRWSLAEPNQEHIGDKTTKVLDAEGLAYHRETSLALLAYTSQAGGYFTKRAESRLNESDKSRYDNPINLARFDRAQELAQRHDVTVTAIPLAYLTSQSFPVVAIIGPRTIEQLEGSLGHIDLTLTPDEVAHLENG